MPELLGSLRANLPKVHQIEGDHDPFRQGLPKVAAWVAAGAKNKGVSMTGL